MKTNPRSMNLLVWAVAGLCAVLAGCSGANHSSPSYVLEGHPYPVEVSVSLKKGQEVQGGVYYRPGGSSEYVHEPLIVRRGGKQLSASLPIDLSVAGQAIEYYIDVMVGGKQYGFYTPATPRRVDVLDREAYVSRSLRVRVAHSHNGEPVMFYLSTGGIEVYDPTVTYQAPGFSGWTTAPMRIGPKGQWEVVVPGHAVQAGWWNYRVDTLVDGVPYGIPSHEWDSFEVQYVDVEKPHMFFELHDEVRKRVSRSDHR